jgi:hypothetical protein
MQDAVAPTDPTHWAGGGSDREVVEHARGCATCTKNEFAIDGLTQALARMRRGAVELRDENVELRAEVSRLRQRRQARP